MFSGNKSHVMSCAASGYRTLLKDASLLSEYLIVLHNSRVYLGQPAGCEASALSTVAALSFLRFAIEEFDNCTC